MKKTNNFNPIFIVVLIAGLLTGCAETHQEAIASLDISTMHFNGVSDFTVVGERELPNLGYLVVEDLLIGLADNPSGANTNKGGPYYASAGFIEENNRLSGLYFVSPGKVAKKTDFFSLSEELEFVGKGDKENSGNGTSSNSLYYLEIPIVMNYNHIMSNGNALNGGVGLYAASGLFGHYSSTFNGMTTSGSIKFGPTADYDRMDYGIVLKAGYTFSKKISAFLNYDFGVRNIYSPEDKLFNRSLGINVAYRIK